MARSIKGNHIGRAARTSEPIEIWDTKKHKSHVCPFCAKHVIPFFDKSMPYNGHCVTHGTVVFVSVYDYEASLFREEIKRANEQKKG